MKRSTAFLRYLIGTRPISCDDELNQSLALYSPLVQITRQAIDLHVGGKSDVDMRVTTTFYDSLYTGLWRYQYRRLEYLMHQMGSSGARKKLTAKISVENRIDQLVLRVGFFAGTKSVDGRDYLLRTRPNESADLCVGRVMDQIEASGIQVVADLRVKSLAIDDIHHGRSNECVLRVAVPI